MDEGVIGLAERRSVIEAAGERLTGITRVLHEASGAELAQLLTVVDSVAAQASAARVAITAEALSRGEVSASGDTAHTWVLEHAPSLRQGGAAHVAAAASALAGVSPVWRRATGAETGDEGVDTATAVVAEGVLDGSVSPGLATAVSRELERLAPHLRDDALPTVARALVDLGLQWGPGLMRRLRPRLLAEYGRPGELDDLQQRLVSAARLSSPVVESGDLTEYQLLMTPEQAAALEAAIGPLSAPCPNEETKERDLRPAGQRRVEALAEVCRRSSALDADGVGPDGAAGAAAAVHVTIGLTELQERVGGGEVLGSTASGTVLSPEILRRICCEADLVPVVLGVAGEDLDLGRVVRLFTRAQRRRLWRRDRGCTYPGCAAPAAWTRAHHVLHWADGGPSDLDNAALLCQRHHTHVHERRLVAEVRRRPDDRGRYVLWDLSPGSYDRRLDQLRAERAALDPPPMTPQRLESLIDAVVDKDPGVRRWARSRIGRDEPDLSHEREAPWFEAWAECRAPRFDGGDESGGPRFDSGDESTCATEKSGVEGAA
ncbi:HNH endonuclease signature motif containing protein [Phycicoccus flavus]|uniref:HNH endonuclease signature motif containing protein n=1 Tax=Phycicoccus flavus TaxID=2502783 RepID=UPI000FEB9BB9|nr:HNH endonuclease signature motif containing protein [Phycicoccus flavus]NHA66836.1 HNH endonuclease [Phycicoccus flavus]